MRKIRVMLYINTLMRGGAERVITLLSEQFAKAGHDVSLVTSFSCSQEYVVYEKVKRYNLENGKKLQSRIVRNCSRIIKLRNLCNSLKPDILISFMQEPSFRAILATVGLPVKMIVSVRNDPNKEYGGAIGRIIGKYILPMADGCVFQTEQAKTWFPKRLQDKAAVIMNPVDDAFFGVKREWPQHVVTVGKLGPQKNHAMLIEAFSMIASKYPDQKLLIYGAGEYEEMLRQQIQNLGLEDRVLLKGRTENVQDVLATAKIFSLPSDYEGMPNALMEALAAGVPSVSTDCPCGGPRTLIQDGENGLLVPVGDAKAMADAMDRLLGDAIAAERMGLKAKQSAELYHPEKIFCEWEEYINRVAFHQE